MIAIPAVSLTSNLISHSEDVQGQRRSRPGSPTSTARELADLGFSRLYVSNGGTTAGTATSELEELIRDADARVQVGAVGATAEVEQLFRAGADVVVVGDRGIDEPEWLADVADLYPDAVAVQTDVRDRRVVRRGWVRSLPIDIVDLVDELNGLPLGELVVSIRALDASMRFGDLALLEDVAERCRFPVFVAGGVSTIQDLRALEHRGIAGAVIDAEKLLHGQLDARAVAQEFGA